jgi:hypothetical protein
MIHKDKVWAFNDYLIEGKPLNANEFPTVSEGDVFISCNITRSKPYTKTFHTIKDLTFINCNLNSIDIRPTWVIDDNCSFVQIEYSL